MGKSERQYHPDEEYEGGTPLDKEKKRVHRWNEEDTRLLPHAIQKALNNLGIPMPWDDIAAQMKNDQSGGAIAQHMAKDCTALKAEGVEVPSPLKRGGKRTPRFETVPYVPKHPKAPISIHSSPSPPPLPKPVPRLAQAPKTTSTAGVEEKRSRVSGRRERGSAKKSPALPTPKTLQTLHHGPLQNGQYKLKCAPVPAQPAFAQRALRANPPPFFKPPTPAMVRPAPAPLPVRAETPPVSIHQQKSPSLPVLEQDTSLFSLQEPSLPHLEQEASLSLVQEPLLPVPEQSLQSPAEELNAFAVPDFDFSMPDFPCNNGAVDQSSSFDASCPPFSLDDFMPGTPPRDPYGWDGQTLNPLAFLSDDPDMGYGLNMPMW